MTPHILLLTLTALLCSCAAPVMKRAHVIPIYDGQILLSAHPEFIGGGPSLYDDARFSRPTIWSYEQLNDGSTVVHWISKPDARERLALMDSGFHPIVVPAETIELISGSGHQTHHREPTVIKISGTNTAFVPEAVTLVPHKP